MLWSNGRENALKDLQINFYVDNVVIIERDSQAALFWKHKLDFIHLSIFCKHLSLSASQGAGAYPSWHWASQFCW